MTYARMADAAFAANIPPGFDIAGGYYPGRADFHAWSPADWQRFPGYRLPITVPGDPGDGDVDAQVAVLNLQQLGVPEGCITVLDMETRKDVLYVETFGAAMAPHYRVWVYGSASTVFGNPPLNGYWAADYTTDMRVIDQLLQAPHVRAVQYNAGPGYDSSLVKPWTEGEMWHG